MRHWMYMENYISVLWKILIVHRRKHTIFVLVKSGIGSPVITSYRMTGVLNHVYLIDIYCNGTVICVCGMQGCNYVHYTCVNWCLF
jgi:hypothetical protein